MRCELRGVLRCRGHVLGPQGAAAGNRLLETGAGLEHRQAETLPRAAAAPSAAAKPYRAATASRT